MDTILNEVKINGIDYVRKSSENVMAEKLDGLRYAIIRTYSAGVFAGYVKERNGKEGIILNSRMLWYWDGACSLSQIAVDGVSKPENCKFTVTVKERELTGIIDVIYCTEKARLNIQGVQEWAE